MNTYKLYSVDRTGKIITAERLEARSDDEAIKLARSLHRDSNCEVWKRTSLVAAIPEALEPMLPTIAL